MSTYKQEDQLAYVPVYIAQTNTEQTDQKQNKARQTDLAVLCAQNQTLKPTIDFSKYPSRGKPKYAPPKYHCIPPVMKLIPKKNF